MANLSYETDRTVYGYFSSEETAEKAVRDLKDAGFTRDQISIAGRPDYDSVDERRSRVDEITGNTTNAYNNADLRGKTHNTAHKAEHAAGGFWQRVRNVFEGDAAEPYSDENTRGDLATHEITGTYDYDPDEFHHSWAANDATGRSRYFTEQYNRTGRGVLVSVNADDRRAEAEQILEANGADLGRSYEDHSETAAGDLDTNTSPANYDAAYGDAAYNTTASASALSGVDRERVDNDIDRENLTETATSTGGRDDETDVQRDTGSPQRIQLYGEVLRVHRDRIQRGEVRVRKEVVTEMQSVQVPVTREEIVVERIPVDGERAASGAAIGQEREIRIPLSEDRVSITREPVVREEVEIGKREVTGTETRQEPVRREELRVDDDEANRLPKAS